MKKTLIYVLFILIGICAIATGIIFDQTFISLHFSDDGTIYPDYIPLIRFYRIFAVCFGVAVLSAVAAVKVFEKQFAAWVTSNVNFKEDGEQYKGSVSFDLFLISFIGLFFEIMMIRWVSSEFRIFGFFKNLILMSSLLGFGIGFAISKRKLNTFSFFPIAVAIFTIIINVGSQKLFLLINSPGMDEHSLWDSGYTLPILANTVLFYSSIVFVFVFNMFLFVGPGQLTGRLMARMKPLTAYSVNVAAGILGIGVFSLISYLFLPPVYWFALGFLLSMWFLRDRSAWAVLNIVFVVVALGFFLQNRNLDITWTPYYKLLTMPYIYKDDNGNNVNIGYSHFVNGAGYINTLDLGEKDYPDYMEYFHIKYDHPYWVKKPKDVLILAGGTGNNAAAALRAGAEHVDVVDIDPGIIKLGKKLHPEHPYTDSRVTVYNNDARNFLRTTKDKKYDMVVFGLLDSHTMFSSMSSIRLDNYVYTMESLTEAKRLLKEDGVLALHFGVPKRWIGNRICEMLYRIFGEVPLNTNYGAFIIGPGVDYDYWRNYPHFVDPVYKPGLTIPATDNWPYLYMKEPGVPKVYIKTLVLLLVVSLALVLIFSPEAKKPLLHYFFLGAAFLLIEFKSMTEAALLFGSTWIINSAVIVGILIMILGANFVISRIQNPRQGFVYLLLFGSLAFNYFVPVSGLLGDSSYLTKAIVSGAFLALPLLFAGIIFASSLKHTQKIELAFSSNLIGAVIGGMLEYSSTAIGIKPLYIIAAGLYLLSFIFRKSR